MTPTMRAALSVMSTESLIDLIERLQWQVRDQKATNDALLHVSGMAYSPITRLFTPTTNSPRDDESRGGFSEAVKQ